jgi:2-hydroxychromene-2-carboxylate isomerase
MEFWFDFASTYSYVAAMRVEADCARESVTLEWKPFLLGPIFSEQLGIRDSPFNVFPVRGRYMWRDLERLGAKHCLPGGARACSHATACWRPASPVARARPSG